MYPGMSTSRPPLGIIFSTVVGLPAACVMPGSALSPNVDLHGWLEHERCGSATRHGTTSSGTASRQRGVRGRNVAQEAGAAPSFFVTGHVFGEAMPESSDDTFERKTPSRVQGFSGVQESGPTDVESIPLPHDRTLTTFHGYWLSGQRHACNMVSLP